MAIKIGCVSDLHGNLIEVPCVDVLVIAGDIQPPMKPKAAAVWYDNQFRAWLQHTLTRVGVVIATPGNHDSIFQERPDLVPRDLPWTVLLDSGATRMSTWFYGTPWQPVFYDWSFNLTEPELERKFSTIPRELDVLIAHGPPFGAGDRGKNGDHLGSHALRAAVLRAAPRLMVCGHIHSGRGEDIVGETRVINASAVDETYTLVNDPVIVVEI